MIRKIAIISLFYFSLLMGDGFVNNETGWTFLQSQQQAFYMFESITVDGEIGEGDGCVPDDFYSICDGVECTCCASPGTCDVLGSFFNGICVGWLYVDSSGFTTAAVNGSDGDSSTSGYPSSGDIVNFKLYDATYDTIIDLIPGQQIPGFQNNGISLIEGVSEANNDLAIGCTDLNACNFDPDAIIEDNDSCIYAPQELEIISEVLNNSVQLSWQDPSGSAPFTYYFNGEEVTSPIVLEDLIWSTNYDFTITVEDANADLCGLVDTTINISIGSEPLPNAVTGLNITSSEGKVMLDWDDVAEHLDYYSIYVTYPGSLTVLETISTDESYFLHDNLLPNTTYEYQVSAINSEGFSGIFSDLVQAVTDPLHAVIQDSPDPGQASIRLFWTIDQNNYNGDNYKFDIHQEGEYIHTTSSSSYLVNNLNPGSTYCFTIRSKITADYLNNESIEYGDFSNEQCAIPDEVTGWGISLSLDVWDWGDDLVSDVNNHLGMHPDATDNYDAAYDVFEPPSSPGTFASFYFPHPEWVVPLANNFTSDFKGLKDLSNNLSVWDAEFISLATGQAQFSFDFISDAGNWPVYFGLQNTSESESMKYYNISDNNINNSIDFTYMPNNEVRLARIIVGNSYPGPPVGLQAVGGPRKIDLYWLERDLCLFDEPLCNDESFSDDNGDGLWQEEEDFIDLNNDNEWTPGIDNRYPATGYKIFKNTELEHLITLMGHEITFYLDQIYINDTESDIDVATISDQILVDYYEVYSDDNMNGIYDDADSFEDCGLDNLCSDSEGYIAADLGEGDGICNRFVRYTPGLGFSGENIITINSPQGSKDITINVVDEMIYKYSDEYLLGSQLYNYYMIAYNHAGDSVPSSLVADITSQNIIPISDAGENQVEYLYNEGQYSKIVTLPKNDDGSNNNESYDPDAFDNEALTYSWEKLSENNIWEEVSIESVFDVELNIGQHDFRHRVKDTSNMWSLYDYVSVELKGLPEPAMIQTLDVISNLYYLELNWDTSQYCEEINFVGGCASINWPEGYTGIGTLAASYEIYISDSIGGNYELLDTVDGSLSQLQESFSYVHNALTPSTSYCYEIYGVNIQGVKSSPQSNCAETGSVPSVDILNPNGGDILVAGSSYDVEWDIENVQYVDNIEIFYSSNNSQDNWQSLFYSDELSTVGVIQIPDTEGITYDNYLKVVINDKGDFYSNNSNTYLDISDNRFIVTNSTLQYEVNSGINVIGSPLMPTLGPLEENLGLNDDNLGFWLAYDEYGNNAFESSLSPGKAFYLVNIDDGYFTLDGEILSSYTLDLHKGWNLISNPLVLHHDLEDIKINRGGVNESGEFISDIEFTWNQAMVLRNLVSPLVFGYDNSQSIHSISSEILPFQGYWVHTPLDDVALTFNSHTYESDPVTEPISPFDPIALNNSALDLIDWSMVLTASEESPSNAQFSIKDFIVLGMDENANEDFYYSEDLYDIPAVVNTKYTNLYINHSDDWFSSGYTDDNDVIVDSPRFMVDIRKPIESNDDFKQWNISGELLGTINSSSLIRLDWVMTETTGIYPISLVIGDSVYNMRDISSVLISGEEFTDFSIQMGNTLDNDNFIVSDFKLTDPYPNPFNPSTTLDLNIPLSDNINIMVYDIKGNLIDVVYEGFIGAGQHKINWNAVNKSSGVYFLKTIYKDQVLVKKAILIK